MAQDETETRRQFRIKNMNEKHRTVNIENTKGKVGNILH